MSFLDQVRAVSSPIESKADVVAYYQQNYKGRGAAGWKQNLIGDLLGIRGITESDVGKAEYARQKKNLAKRFEPKRIGTPEAGKTGEEYELLGESLPPTAPEGGYHVWGIIHVKMSDGDCEEREIDEEIVGEDAQQLLTMSNADMLQAIVNHYMSDGDLEIDEPIAAIGDCRPPNLQVEPIEE